MLSPIINIICIKTVGRSIIIAVSHVLDPTPILISLSTPIMMITISFQEDCTVDLEIFV